MRKTIQGPFYPVRLKLVSKRTLMKLWGKNEVLLGMYDGDTNTIYIAEGQTPERQLHTLMHEIVHMLIDQTSNLDEDAKCDVIGSWLIRHLDISNLKKVLK